MTPEQKLKWAILQQYFEWNNKPLIPYPCHIREDELYEIINLVDDLYNKLYREDELYDAINEVRSSGIATNLPSPNYRYYESKSVAMKMPDDSWVGWTYWYGGGKHSEPESIDWIEHAYDVECREEEKTHIVQTFTKL